METKRFDLGTVLSATTGRLLTKRFDSGDNGIGDLYKLLGWMTDDSPFTHQLPRFSQECKPWLLKWFPELAAADESLWVLDEKVKSLGPEHGVGFWLTNLQMNGMKAEYDVPQIPKGEHQQRDPIAELCDMVGKDKVIVVKS